ncbi:hypothetical protein AAC387_Pa07g2565 [Persea americana]
MAPKKRKNVADCSSSSRFDAAMFPSLAKYEAYAELFANPVVGSERHIDESFKSIDEYGSIMARHWNFLYTFDIDEINFLMSKEVDWHQLDAVRRIHSAINRQSLQQSEAHLTEGEDDDGDNEAAEGEQDSVLDRLTRLENEVHAMNENINALNSNVNARFTYVDESLAAILVRLGHQ